MGWNESLMAAGLTMNVEKTEVLRISRNDKDKINVIVQEKSVRNVYEVNYLRSLFSTEGTNKAEITDIIKRSSKNIYLLHPLLKTTYIPLKY